MLYKTIRACFTIIAVNCDPNTWWILKSSGITIAGPEIKSLPINVSEQDLVYYVSENMNEYWAPRVSRIEDAVEYTLLQDSEIDAEIEWCILGLLRQFYTIREQKVISKAGAGHYGLKHIPIKWHPIINKSLHKEVKAPLNSSKEQIESAIELSKQSFLLAIRFL
ncbi:aminoglycoside adenylyltransferase domain-containing protein [Pseudalkalibacillus hwajinpoensis]|uniref:aminoglycoside adenylyltransferase domain-containing protein n=1 Tax=Guptibacillus hwajinpoensis TaxID=208199 RepID=UPI00325B2328